MPWEMLYSLNNFGDEMLASASDKRTRLRKTDS